MTPFDSLLKLPCGRCIGCRLEQSRQKAVRAMHEASLHEHNCSLTLTYDSNYRPKNDLPTLRVDKSKRADLTTGSNIAQDRAFKSRATRSRGPVDSSALKPSGGPEKGLSTVDHQKFLKRYRKKFGPLRFMMCGEYGEKMGRPHYHYVIFGHDFVDKYYWKKSPSGEKLYRSATLEQLWPFGDALIGNVTFESASYVAGYVTKKMVGDEWEPRHQCWCGNACTNPDTHYRRTDANGNDYWLPPEFGEMSRRPGIGYHWICREIQHVYARDSVIVNQHEAKPPRYYDNIAAQLRNRIDFDAIKQNREEKRASGNDSPERLRAGETIQHAAIHKRSLEK